MVSRKVDMSDDELGVIQLSLLSLASSSSEQDFIITEDSKEQSFDLCILA